MRFISKYLAACALVVGGAVLHADTTPGDTSVTTNVKVSGSAQLSVADMQMNAKAFETQIQEQYLAVVRLQEKVRIAKDVIKLNCINDKLVQLKAQMNLAEQANRQLADALAKNSDERHSAYSEYEQASSAVQKLHDEAKGCVGEPELFKGEDYVEVTHPPFPDDPTTDNPFDDVITGTDVEPPGYASLFY